MTRRSPAAEGSVTRAVYLETERDPVFAIAHLPASVGDGATGVVLCPPLGWEDTSTYRTRRVWANALARAGQPAVRIDLPGTGDSAGSPHDPERLEAWVEAVAAAARWLREETGCRRVAGLGIGFGGMIAWMAAARGAPIDDLMLWATPTQGLRLLREIRAAALLRGDDGAGSGEHMAVGADDPLGPLGGSALLDVAGNLITKETVDALARLDLTELPLARAELRRILLFESDGTAVDQRMQDHLEASGADVTVASGDGYGAMMQDARHAKIPDAAIEYSVVWLAGAGAGATVPSATAEPSPARARALPTLELCHGGAQIRETPMTIELESRKLFGILTEPAGPVTSDVCAVMFNVGSERRIGPSRAWVETARRWAAQGVPVVRLDQSGIGDSDGDERYEDLAEYYDAHITNRTVATLDALEARGLPARFVLVGLCTGAYWSFQGALGDRRVVGAFAINLPFFFRTWWAIHVLHAWAARRRPREEDRPATSRARSALSWLFPVLPLGRRALRAVLRAPDSVDRAVNELRDRSVELLLMFSGGEPQYDELIGDRRIERFNRLPNVHVRRIPGRDHSIRPLPVQRYVSHELDAALMRVLRADAAIPSSDVVARALRSGGDVASSDVISLRGEKTPSVEVEVEVGPRWSGIAPSAPAVRASETG
jgi:pimeloyl-ACP methyl ester carboxylesterase